MNIFRVKKYKNQGFTLLETMIYFTLLSIILLVVVDLFFRISESSLESSTKNALEVEGSTILNRFAYDIHRVDRENGDEIFVPKAPGESRPVIALLISGVPYVYVSLDTNLTYFIYGQVGTMTPLTSDSVETSNISFERISNNNDKPTIKLKFTLKSTTQSKDGTFESRDFESVFSIR